MKILKILLIVIVVVVAVVFAVSFTAPTEITYEKSIQIDAPVALVWENINSLEDLNAWSPWLEKDPDMQREMSGTDGEVGATYSWSSENEEVGAGSQTIAGLDAPNRIDTDLTFESPQESQGKAWVELTEDGEGTTATWGLWFPVPRPFNLMMMNVDMEEMMGEDYGAGLTNLKAMSEEMNAQAIMETEMMVENDTTVTVE